MADHSYCSRVRVGEIVSCQTYRTIKLVEDVVLCPCKSCVDVFPRSFVPESFTVPLHFPVVSYFYYLVTTSLLFRARSNRLRLAVPLSLKPYLVGRRFANSL